MSEVGGGATPGPHRPEPPPDGGIGTSLPELLRDASNGSEIAARSLQAALRNGVRLVLARRNRADRTEQVLWELVETLRREGMEESVAPARWILRRVLRAAESMPLRRPPPEPLEAREPPFREAALQVLCGFPEEERDLLAGAFAAGGHRTPADRQSRISILLAQARARFRKLLAPAARQHAAGS